MDIQRHPPLLGQRGMEHHGALRVMATPHLHHQDGELHPSTHLDNNLPMEGLGETPMVETEEVGVAEEVEAGEEVTLQTLADHLKTQTMEILVEPWENQQMSPQTGTQGIVEPHARESRQSHPQCEKPLAAR